jgi:FecR-like protein
MRSIDQEQSFFKEQRRDHNISGWLQSSVNRQVIVPFIYVLIALFMVILAGVAQAQTSTQAIGQVETLNGNATAMRVNNTTLNLKIGDAVFSGDRVQTGPNSTLGITFLDQTVFSIGANARMVLDDLVYNPQGSANNMAFNLVEGTFVFLAGRIATTGNMRISTPVVQIGIRGTLPWITIGNTTSFAILSEPDGTTGQYDLLRLGTGNVIATVSLATVGTRQKFVMASPDDDPQIVDKTPEELAAEQQFRNQVFNTLDTRDTRLGNAPDPGNDPGQGPPPGDPGTPPPTQPPGDQGAAPFIDPSDSARVDQANAVVAACTRSQAKINRALQLYLRGDFRQSRQLLQEARNDIGQLPPEACGTLLERIAGGQQVVDQVEEDGRNALSAINNCNENEINRLRNRYASSRQDNAKVILTKLDKAAKKCANRRIQRARAAEKSRANAECRRLNGSGYYAGKIRGDGSYSCRPTKKTANAWCRNKNGRGYYAGRIKANGSFSCNLSRQERSRQAWAACRRQYGRRLADVRFFKSGRYRCIVRQDPPPQQVEQGHDPVTSAAVIGGILGAIDGLSKRHKKSRSRYNDDSGYNDRRRNNDRRRTQPLQRGPSDHCKNQSIGGC